MAERWPTVTVRGPRSLHPDQLTDGYASCLRCRALVRRSLYRKAQWLLTQRSTLVDAYPDSQGIYTLHSLTCTAPRRRRRSSLAPARSHPLPQPINP